MRAVNVTVGAKRTGAEWTPTVAKRDFSKFWTVYTITVISFMLHGSGHYVRWRKNIEYDSANRTGERRENDSSFPCIIVAGVRITEDRNAEGINNFP
ncbi:hypothetical protein BV898_19712 [Hypsibius exemplaris]|uniref:Uncharacterized protein n=1 Tax=Hypsibius exemplaris TaxID=2072580 RepID=A0A9X6NM43_HYPEX|nr:hypothetical protein BV898_19712 [Hypsibius exemplaris]